MSGIVASFTTVLNLSITASYVAVGVLLVRLLLRQVPKVYSYALWSAVLIRMVLPITLTSAFSLLGIMHAGNGNDSGRLTYVPQSIGLMQQPQISTGIASIDHSVNAGLPEAVVTNSVNPMQLMMMAASIAWVAGMVILLGFSFYTYLNVARKVRTATRLMDNVYETDRIASPFVFGLIRPRIYVPVGLATDELLYIVAHEQAHIRRRDHWIKPAAYLALIVHWFNPLLWFSFGSMSKDMEMACDESVLKSLGRDSRQRYSQTLLALSTGKRAWLQGGPLTFGENHVAARIKRIIRYKTPCRRAIVITFLILVVFIAGFAVNPKPNSNPTQEQTASQITGERDPYPAAELLNGQTPYVGNNSKVIALIDQLPVPGGLTRGKVQLHTSEPPYGLTIYYKIDDQAGSEKGQELASGNRFAVFYRNAAILFSLIGNLDQIEVDHGDPDGMVYTVDRTEMDAHFGSDVRLFAQDEQSFADFVKKVKATEMGASHQGSLQPDENGVYVLSTNRLQLANRSKLDVRVEMVEGKHQTEEEAGGPGGGVYADNYTGVYQIRVIDTSSAQGNTLSVYSGLSEDFGQQTLNFGGNFSLAWADYNGDGQPDFTLGQWGGSNGSFYYLYTLNKRGEIEQLNTEGELYYADHWPSVLLDQLEGNRFATKYYDQESGEYKKQIYEWDKDKARFTGVK